MERLYRLRRVVTRLFGYIRPEQSELLVKEYEFYKAVYCGICREGGRKISRLTRFFLNHDFVFLSRFPEKRSRFRIAGITM